MLGEGADNDVIIQEVEEIGNKDQEEVDDASETKILQGVQKRLEIINLLLLWFYITQKAMGYRLFSLTMCPVGDSL